MAYRPKYYFNFEADGRRGSLTIKRKNYSGSSHSLSGLLQSIRLCRQGDEVLESPIVKSSLAVTLCDRDGGMWEEFFTPDATEYQVVLNVNEEDIWIGYLTPDSYEEDLRYRGSITITARDMLGHLADIPFNATNLMLDGNLASVYDIIEEGLRLADCPMQLDFHEYGDRTFYKAGGYSCDAWLVDTRGCEGKNFYDVIEGILEGLGLTMRWESTGYIVVAPVTDLNLGGREYDGSTTESDVQFWNVSGHRSLEPAYRGIEETLSYNLWEGDNSEWLADAFGSGDRLTGMNGWSQLDSSKKVASQYVRSGSIYENLSAGDTDHYALLYAQAKTGSNTGTSMSKEYALPPCTKAMLSFELSRLFDINKVMQWAHAGDRLPSGTLEYYVQWVANGGTTYYLRKDGGWSTDATALTLVAPVADDIDGTPNTYHYSSESTIKAEHTFSTPNAIGTLRVTLFAFKHTLHRIFGEVDTDPYWVRLGNIKVEPQTDLVAKDLKVGITYDTRQNYTLKRQPKFGKTPRAIGNAGLILNGFYLPTEGHPSVQDARIGSGSALPLPVVVDMEILRRHTGTTSTLTGTIAPKRGICDMSARWYWNGRMFILQGGSYNPVGNCIEGAILREYLTGNSFELDNYEIK